MLDLTRTPDRPLVAPSVLASDFGAMAQDAQDAMDRGADLLHLDVMDGHFVPNLTFGQDTIKGLRKHLPDTFLDVHLMVTDPAAYVTTFAQAGANNFTFHLETAGPFHPNATDADRLIDQILASGMHASMVVNPYTGVEALAPYLDRLTMVLIMSVVPGFGGQSFMPHVLQKAQWLRQTAGDRLRIQIDGGINADTCDQAVNAGVDVLVAGSAVFGHQADARTKAIARLKASGSNPSV